jgi:hypothetical protein
VMIEFGVNVIMAVAGGFAGQSCLMAAVVLTLTAFLYVVLLIALRPSVSPSELGFSLFAAVGQFLATLLAGIYATQDSTNETLVAASGIVANVVLYTTFFRLVVDIARQVSVVVRRALKKKVLQRLLKTLRQPVVSGLSSTRRQALLALEKVMRDPEMERALQQEPDSLAEATETAEGATEELVVVEQQEAAAEELQRVESSVAAGGHHQAAAVRDPEELKAERRQRALRARHDRERRERESRKLLESAEQALLSIDIEELRGLMAAAAAAPSMPSHGAAAALRVAPPPRGQSTHIISFPDEFVSEPAPPRSSAASPARFGIEL